MSIIKKIFLGLIALFLLNTAYGQSTKNDFDTDKFLRTIDLEKLIFKNKSLNLIAELSSPRASTSDVNDMDEFFAIGSPDNSSTIITQFDRFQDILHQVDTPEPWVGVTPFKQTQIPLMTLQQGFDAAQQCMAKKGTPISNSMTSVTIYRTLQSSMVYDYTFTDSGLPTGFCQEVLYVPSKQDCAFGMVVFCHMDMSTLEHKIK